MGRSRISRLLFSMIFHGLGWPWIVVLDGFNTNIKCVATQLLPNESWYIANTLFPPPYVSSGFAQAAPSPHFVSLYCWLVLLARVCGVPSSTTTTTTPTLAATAATLHNSLYGSSECGGTAETKSAGGSKSSKHWCVFRRNFGLGSLTFLFSAPCFPPFFALCFVLVTLAI